MHDLISSLTIAKGLTVTVTITVFYLQSLWVKGVRKQVVKDITTPPYPWQPMLVLANRKSGDNLGQSVLQMFRHLLNPAQVIVITEILEMLYVENSTRRELLLK